MYPTLWAGFNGVAGLRDKVVGSVILGLDDKDNGNIIIGFVVDDK